MTDRNNEFAYENENEYAGEYEYEYDQETGRRRAQESEQGQRQGQAQGHGYAHVPRNGGWEPVPHGGEYEPDATAFVQLPPDMDMMGAPLAAPGHGYVPPMIVPLTPAAATDPGSTGVWRIPTDLGGQGAPGASGTDPAPGAQTVVWPEPPAPAQVPATPTQPAHDPSATAQWNFADDPSLAGTGQWTIPVAEGELPEESGEFTTSSLIEQWGSTPPATLPGGAPAPWANQLPQPAAAPAPEGQEPAPEHAPLAAEAPDAPVVRDAATATETADTAEAPTAHPGHPAHPGHLGHAGHPGHPAPVADATTSAPGVPPVSDGADGAEEFAPSEASEVSQGAGAPSAPGTPEAPFGYDPHGDAHRAPHHDAPHPGQHDPHVDPHVGAHIDPRHGAYTASASTAEPVAGAAPETSGPPESGQPARTAETATTATTAVTAVGTADEARAAGAPDVPGATDATGAAGTEGGAATPALAHGPAGTARSEALEASTPDAPADSASDDPAAQAPSPEGAPAEPSAAEPELGPASRPEPEPDSGKPAAPASEALEADGASGAPGVLGALGTDPDPEPLLGAPELEHPRASYVLRVNGADRPVTEAWVGESLLYVLRERLGLAGAKDGCSQGECGACNVQVDGRLVASCLVPAATTAGSEVRTVEGLATDGEPSDVQRALAESGAVQCGFCIPGMAMTVHDLLEGNHAPTELETRQALCGNLCRCSGYRGVLDAVKDVVAGREAAGANPADEARIPHQAPPGAGSAKPPHTHDGGMA
ncbi:2Fe-2S iron-sulfur cluster-binding protein [Streptomyces sp. NPDC048111]|uniref:2Fe-2S iron-sulfur cluster-binding protein n=1 Tax=Streptomyces sp. NPDC048111 TaxID=3365500 RepID=UPI00372360F4